ncbi:MAG: 30S ribosomal protein S7 [Deltaproteobacteria bacterium]|nr:30S ribosomal protein S7 [Deltaproteobacteria bacterium]MBW2340456.1 30S ribosomal protein S7 [Deltaproteobacteria bacterium]
MTRKAEVIKRDILPDPKYKSELVTRFTNRIMKKGKKNLAQSILYEAFDIIHQKTKEDPLSLFQKAIENVKPAVEVRSRRVGGSTYQVPTEVRTFRRNTLSIRWILTYAQQRGETSMPAKLAGELIDASNGRGGAFKKKEDTHRMAEANKAFAHYRW